MDEKIILAAEAFVTGKTWKWLPHFLTGEETPSYREPSIEETIKMSGVNIRENVIEYLKNNKL